MLFPLMIGVAIGIALERHYLADMKEEECKDKPKKKEKDEKKDDSNESE